MNFCEWCLTGRIIGSFGFCSANCWHLNHWFRCIVLDLEHVVPRWKQ